MKTKNLSPRCSHPIFIIAAVIAFSLTARVNAQTIDIGPNEYAFQFTQNPNFGLFFNSTDSRYEFRDGSASPVFAIGATNGQLQSNLSFGSNSDFLVNGDRYAFRFSGDPDFGLYFNGTDSRYEFRNGSANPVFGFNASNGQLTTNLQFTPSASYIVAPNNYAIRSAANDNIGLYFGPSDYEFRNSSGTSVLNINANTGEIISASSITADGGNSAEWTQAHSWGDHAAAGYISSESDPKISDALEVGEIPRWNGSELSGSAISASTSTASVTGTPSDFAISGSPEGSTGNLFVLENPGAAPGTVGLTSETRLAFSKNNVVTGRISTVENNMNFAATDNGNITFRTGGNDQMTILPNGDVGLGLTDPSHRLHVSGTVRATTSSYAIRGTKTGSGTFPGVWGETESTSSGASGVRGYVNSTSPGSNSAGVYGFNAGLSSLGYGVRGVHAGSGSGVYGESDGGIGVYGNSDGTTSLLGYGVFGRAVGSGGTRVGVYGFASGGDANWAGYFVGATYVSGDLRVGTSSGATGYKLSVNGKAICTEMRVQQTSNWPDYVFDESYERLSLDELEAFIQTKKHLPNVPSAAELQEQGGVDLGEMQRLTIEKVEELTLYLLELKESNDALSEMSETLRSENEALRKRIEALEN